MFFFVFIDLVTFSFTGIHQHTFCEFSNIVLNINFVLLCTSPRANLGPSQFTMQIVELENRICVLYEVHLQRKLDCIDVPFHFDYSGCEFYISHYLDICSSMSYGSSFPVSHFTSFEYVPQTWHVYYWSCTCFYILLFFFLSFSLLVIISHNVLCILSRQSNISVLQFHEWITQYMHFKLLFFLYTSVSYLNRAYGFLQRMSYFYTSRCFEVWISSNSSGVIIIRSWLLRLYDIHNLHLGTLWH